MNLEGRRDASFLLCGEVSRFIYRLCFRCYTSDTVPLENDWYQLLSFKTEDGTFMPRDDFLLRLKLHNRVSAASKLKAEGLHSGKRSDKATIQKSAEKIKEDFAQSGLSFVSYLLGEILSLSGLKSEIVKGLAAFDPFILFRRPYEVGLKHFNSLYRVFLLSSWVTAENEGACRDEYLELVDYLQSTYPASFDVTTQARDLIDFLIGLDFLQSRAHLLYLFKLCCLCVTECGDDFPVISSGEISTSDYRSRLSDVILPGQSYLSKVPDSVAYCCSEASLSSFSLLSAGFGRKAFAADYDPWVHVDTFGRAAIYKSLMSSYKRVLAGPKTAPVPPDSDGASTVVDAAAVNVPSKLKRKRQSGGQPGSASSSDIGEPRPGSSKF